MAAVEISQGLIAALIAGGVAVNKLAGVVEYAIKDMIATRRAQKNAHQLGYEPPDSVREAKATLHATRMTADILAALDVAEQRIIAVSRETRRLILEELAETNAILNSLANGQHSLASLVKEHDGRARDVINDIEELKRRGKDH